MEARVWKRKINFFLLAIPIVLFNTQLGIGEWSQSSEEADMRAKDAAEVLLFVINEETRGVATVGEVS